MELIEKYEEFLGYEGESLAREIEYEVDDEYLQYNIFINFDTPVGKYRVQVPSVNHGAYTVEPFLMQRKGTIKAQLEARNENGELIAESAIVDYIIAPSIDTEGETVEDIFKLEEKEIEVTEPEIVVETSPGFYGMKKVKIDAGRVSRIVQSGTSEYWNSQPELVGELNSIYVYTDAFSYQNGNETIYVPGIKIGDGNAHLIDKSFVADNIAVNLLNHIRDKDMHITTDERRKWNDKLNCDTYGSILILNRN